MLLFVFLVCLLMLFSFSGVSVDAVCFSGVSVDAIVCYSGVCQCYCLLFFSAIVCVC